MTGKKKLVALVLAIAVFFAVMLSVFVITHDAAHECAGIGCQICQRMESARQTLKMLISGVLTIAFALALAYICYGLLNRFAQHLLQSTLVALRVELLN